MLYGYYNSSVAHKYFGNGLIQGLPTSDPPSGVYVVETPASKRVTLITKSGKDCVAQLWSHADGSFRFNGLADRAYLVIAEDETQTYDAVIADNVWPTVEGAT